MPNPQVILWLICLLTVIRPTIGDDYSKPPQKKHLKLNLNIHVPPLIFKMPRMSMPKMSIKANFIRQPYAKPMEINVPPPPEISFGDGYDQNSYQQPQYGGGGGDAYQQPNSGYQDNSQQGGYGGYQDQGAYQAPPYASGSENYPQAPPPPYYDYYGNSPYYPPPQYQAHESAPQPHQVNSTTALAAPSNGTYPMSPPMGAMQPPMYPPPYPYYPPMPYPPPPGLMGPPPPAGWMPPFLPPPPPYYG